ncbi:SDR family NAD(P)-dependent oxidoreductase [Thermomonas carbonis]|uniref:SDR family NAD(P)-dependent oxidoreductase n=1 Tax=Thermomonas carbonis TaxID=1463158 RepID=A0A7G9SQQ7_9GAMM|nr:SDR family NAD(P)-dependent oxidoreductase [Thermomonas carbonis]QNN70182.1 SDR family NAD(P)-dependent oxidoreductase [Thermomonas carbonis]GHB98324.1 short-chain dehydrogenase [Thermomonas carbonis]
MSNTTSLEGRVVLVAGAAGGLGSAASVACAQAGATVVLLGRKVAALNRVYDAVKAIGPEPVLYPLDLVGATPDDYDELAGRIETELGRLDGMLHCAAEFKGLTPLLHTDPADFARAIHVDLTARWWLTQACLPLLARSDAGAVVFALDDPARTDGAFWGGYGLAQSAQASMVSMLQAELGEHGPCISGFRPGPMRTALRGKAYQPNADAEARAPADYAAACVELLSPVGSASRGRIVDAS